MRRSAVLGVVLACLLLTACSATGVGPAATTSPAATRSVRPSPSALPGFDVCSLLPSTELVKLGLSPDARVAYRQTTDEPEQHTCGYGADPLVGRQNVQATIVVWAHAAQNQLDNLFPSGRGPNLPGIGDQAYVDSPGSPYARVVVRAGSRVVELDYDGLERGFDSAAADVLRGVMARLPDKIQVPPVQAYGLCGQIDRALAGNAQLNAQYPRTTSGPNGDVSCDFEGMEVRSISGPAARSRFEKFKREQAGTSGYGVPVADLGDEAYFAAWSDEGGTGVNAWIRVRDRYLHFQAWGDLLDGEGALGIESWESKVSPPAPMLEFLQSLPGLV